MEVTFWTFWNIIGYNIDNEAMHRLTTMTFQLCSCNMENSVRISVQYKYFSNFSLFF